MLSNQRLVILVFFLAILSAYGWNEWNKSLIQTKNPQNTPHSCGSVWMGSTIYNIDNADYLSIAYNILHGNGMACSSYKNEQSNDLNYEKMPDFEFQKPIGVGSYFVRMPGYPLVIASFVRLFGVERGFLTLRWAQLMLFGLAAVCVYKIGKYISNDCRVSFLIVGLFSILPFCSGYLYFTITESITMPLVLFYVFFLFRAYYNPTARSRSLLISSILIAFIIMTRPVLGLLGALLPAVIYLTADEPFKNIGSLAKRLLLFAIIPIIALSCWTVRNYQLSGRIIPLETSVSPEALTIYRPAYNSIFSFVRCFNADGHTFNLTTTDLLMKALKGDSSDANVNMVLDGWGEQVNQEFGRQKLFNSLKKFQLHAISLRPFFEKEIPIPISFYPEELAIKKEFEQYTKEYKSQHFFDYWVKASGKNLLDMVNHSNTSNLFLFQDKNMPSPILFLIKLFLKTIHVLCYLIIFLNLFLIKDKFQWLLFVGLPIVFILFFTVFFRLFEQRYMLPYLPFLLLGFVFPILYFKNHFFNKLKSIQ